MRSFVGVMFVLAGTLLPGIAVEQMPVRPCESLSALTLPHTAVTMAAVVPKAGFSRAQVGAKLLVRGRTVEMNVQASNPWTHLRRGNEKSRGSRLSGGRPGRNEGRARTLSAPASRCLHQWGETP